MGVPGNANALLLASAAVSGGYQVSRSLRFNSGDSAYLNRTPASAGNRKTWTWAGWVKRSALGTDQNIFGTNSTTGLYFQFQGDNTFKVLDYTGSTSNYRLETTQVFRDVGAWMHIVFALDTTLSTANDRIKLYVNGTQITAFSTRVNPSQNYDGVVNSATTHTIGRLDAQWYLDGYLADVHLLDGIATDPSSFAETDATTGQWVPKAFTGSYGTNGFRLAFDSYATTAALGTDTSGNGNTWSVNNFSVTAGSGNDSLVDTPTSIPATDTGVGGEVRGNYCTWNPLFSSSFTYANGNLDITSANSNAHATIGVSAGKWYWEATPTTVGNTNDSLRIGVRTSTSAYTGYVRNRAADLQYGTQVGDGGTADSVVWQGNTTYGLSLDCDNNQLKVYKANSLIATVTIQSGQTWFPWLGAEGTTATWVFNWGARPFAYTAPSGFKALCDTNLGAPLIAKPDQVFQTVLYTGNGASRSITGLNFAPDFLWIKNRNFSGYNHHLTDAVRGVTQRLKSNTAGVELTSTDQVTAYNSNGFSLGADSAGPGDLEVNQNTGSYVGWCWDAGTSTVTNTAGSITSQVRANASAGFSVVTYTGNGSNATVGHGLGIAPSMTIVKVRNRSGDNWLVYHKSLSTPATDYLLLSATSASGTLSGYWNGGPTSSVIGLGNYSAINNNGDSYVAYSFAPVSGYSSFGTYVGTGSGEGSFVYTGFKPKWVMCKRSDSTGNWVLVDGVRTPYNVINTNLYPNASNAEDNGFQIDSLSNGFKVRSSGTDGNASGGTYIFAAFAESPFQYSRAR